MQTISSFYRSGLIFQIIISVVFSLSLTSCGDNVQEPDQINDTDLSAEEESDKINNIKAYRAPSKRLLLEQNTYEETYLTEKNLNVTVCEEPGFSTTHPDKPCVPDNIEIPEEKMGLDLFDWRATPWEIYNPITKQTEYMDSPFYSRQDGLPFIGDKRIVTDPDLPASIPDFSSTRGTILPDFMPENGWELIKANLGYRSVYRNGRYVLTPGNITGGIPHIILYNRFEGKLRVIAKYNNQALNFIKICLKIAEKDASGNASLSGNSVFNFKGKDQTHAKKTESGARYCDVSRTSSLNQFVYADFFVRYDMCTPYGNSDMILSFQPFNQGEIELAGREIGAITNIKDTEINNRFISGFAEKSSNEALKNPGTFIFNDLESLKKTYEHMEYKITGYVGGSVSPSSGGAARTARYMAKGTGEILEGLDSKTFPAKALGKFIKAGGEFSLSGFNLLSGSIFSSKPLKLQSHLVLPNPMPMVSHSEIYLKGTSVSYQSETTFRYALPGSKDQVTRSDDQRITTPLSTAYMNPLGVIDILKSPEVKIIYPQVNNEFWVARSGNVYTAIIDDDEGSHGGWYSKKFPYPKSYERYGLRNIDRQSLRLELSNMKTMLNPTGGLSHALEASATIVIHIKNPQYDWILPPSRYERALKSDDLFFYNQGRRSAPKKRYADLNYEFPGNIFYALNYNFRSSSGRSDYSFKYYQISRWIKSESGGPSSRFRKGKSNLYENFVLKSKIGAPDIPLVKKEILGNSAVYVSEKEILVGKLSDYYIQTFVNKRENCNSNCLLNSSAIMNNIDIEYALETTLKEQEVSTNSDSHGATVTDKKLNQILEDAYYFARLQSVSAKLVHAFSPNTIDENSLKDLESERSIYCQGNSYQTKYFQ